MTPAHTDSPLRRSEVGVFRDGVQNVPINDDEEERRQARRRTLLSETGSTTLEESETLKKCLEIYNGNKLSKENAWSLSLIDTLSTLLDKHHKSLNNFKVAGSSLEASSKVYGLRVDSIHTDVLRMSAGLNAHKFSNRAAGQEDDDDESGNAVENNEPNNEDGGGEKSTDAPASKPAKPKRTRKQVSTVTKNKESLNARLDTVPLTDPVFGKLNSIVGSINSSNRLLNNILHSTDSELRLRLDFPFWDGSTLEPIDYTEEYNFSEEPVKRCEKLIEIKFEDLKLRPMHHGYVITDTPEDIDDEAEKENRSESPPRGFEDDFNHEMSMAFDINADVEQIPSSAQTAPVVDVDFGDYEDLTSEERVAIHQCKGLRKPAVLLEDLRPVDSSSKLEYSYRPLDKISQFWAGPSHWKFKRPRARSSIMAPQQQAAKSQPSRPGRPKLRQSKHVNFGEFHDDLFVKLDEKFKTRKTNVQKKWDARKLKLPTDLQLDPNMFFKFRFAPGIPVEEDEIETEIPHVQTESPFDDFGGDEPHHTQGNDDDDHGDDAAGVLGSEIANLTGVPGGESQVPFPEEREYDADSTVIEIATDYEGAPNAVTKIIVPFAKRAKVIDMKSLKKCCSQLMQGQMSKPIAPEKIPKLPIPKEEEYAGGVASFQEIYTHLPDILSPSMAEALSPSVAFYSILHLANDLNLRLIPQTDLSDFKIRQVL